jgi:hypothetical protein
MIPTPLSGPTAAPDRHVGRYAGAPKAARSAVIVTHSAASVYIDLMERTVVATQSEAHVLGLSPAGAGMGGT